MWYKSAVRIIVCCRGSLSVSTHRGHVHAHLIVKILHVAPELERKAEALRLTDEPVWRAIAVLVLAVSRVRPVAQGCPCHVALRQLQQVTTQSEGPLLKLLPGS